MAIVVRCPFCKSDHSYKVKTCKNCGKKIPQKGRDYRVVFKQLNGTWIKKSVGSSLELAKDIEAKIKIELIEDTYFDRKKKIPTLHELWQKYLPWAKENKKSWDTDVYRYNTHLSTYKDDPLNKITSFTIQKKVSELKKKGYTATTIKHIVGLLKRMFNLAIKWGDYDSNPTKNVTLPRIHNERVVRVEIEDINKLLQVLDGYFDQAVANLVKFALFTGLRRGEIFKLKWKDINLPKGWLYIRDPKGGRDQVIPLNKSALGVLAQQEKETEYVFPGQYGEQRKNIRPHWLAIRAQAGLSSDLHFHDLRHVYATILASSGEVDLYTLQKLMTHKTSKMTQRYAHIIEERLRKATCVIDRVLKRGRV